VESDVVLKIGVFAAFGEVCGDEGFDFDLPTLKRSRNVGEVGFFDAFAAEYAKSEGDGFECAGGRK